MLLHQGAAAFTLWTGQPAPLELMQQRLEAARAGGIRSAEGEPAGDEPPAAMARLDPSAAAAPMGRRRRRGCRSRGGRDLRWGGSAF